VARGFRSRVDRLAGKLDSAKEKRTMKLS
jgi:hypothetical protein